ncbi:MAG: hypothetical protein VB858_02635 [Planctomycetaceae bacterium]
MPDASDAIQGTFYPISASVPDPQIRQSTAGNRSIIASASDFPALNLFSIDIDVKERIRGIQLP